jgi:hypothetical protein
MSSNRVQSAGSVCPRLLLLLCCLSLGQPAVAGWDLQEASLSAGELDRAFEVEVYHLLQQRLGGDAVRYVRIIRFGNTLLLTGEVRSDAVRSGVDAVVLEAGGIRREAPDTTGVVPARTRDCGGKPVTGNDRRKQIVSGNRDCSALRAAPEAAATGRLINHLDLIGAEPDRHAAAADVLAAQARLALVEAGYPQALDRDAMRLAAQGGVLYVLLPEGAAQSGIEAVLLQVPGVVSVSFYTG